MVAGRPTAGSNDPATYAGAIDCDLHPALPGMQVLLPYLDDYWREMVSVRALDRLNLTLTSYPQNAPLSCRPDWKPEGAAKPGASLEAMQRHVLDRYQPRFGILNCLYGAQVMHSEDMAAVLCRATNDWIRDEWLNRDPRLRASIVIPAHNTELAVWCPAKSRSAAASSGRFTRPPNGSAFRSGFMPAALIVTRRPRWAGRPILSKTTSRNPPPSRTSCRA